MRPGPFLLLWACVFSLIDARRGYIHSCGQLSDVSTNSQIHEYEELGSRAQFDTVLTIHALDRCNDALRALRNMYGALRPGGVLVLYDRVYVGMARTVSPLARALPSKDAHQLRYISHGLACRRTLECIIPP